MATIVPPPLTGNDKVSIIAPAGALAADRFEAGLTWLTTHFHPLWHLDILLSQGYLAGSDERRAALFQRALDNDDVRAIWAARGGFGTTRILDRLNFDAFAAAPKWVVGSSDLTACLVVIWARYRIATLHGPMVAGALHTDERDLTQSIRLLHGEPWLPPSNLKGLFAGRAEGPLIGGNLTVLAHLAGTLPARFSDGAILFLEDVGEKPYRIDRSLTQLERSGILDNVNGILLGEFTDCDPGPDGTTAMEVLERNLAPLDIPVAAGYPAAHGPRNAPFVHGAVVHLEVQGSRAHLKLPL